MQLDDPLRAFAVVDDHGRSQAIEVLRATYQAEKNWIDDPESQFAAPDLRRNDIAWFVVTWNGEPAGVLRVLYDPPLALYAQYGFRILDPSLRIEDFVRRYRVAEIGRFAVVPDYRGQFLVAAALMRAATEATVARGYTHFITDVFEDDPHSPLGFHTRVMGFHPVATHDVGELRCRSRRVTMLLDIKAAYQRLKGRRNWLFRYLTGDWHADLHRRLAA